MAADEAAVDGKRPFPRYLLEEGEGNGVTVDEAALDGKRPLAIRRDSSK